MSVMMFVCLLSLQGVEGPMGEMGEPGNVGQRGLPGKEVSDTYIHTYICLIFMEHSFIHVGVMISSAQKLCRHVVGVGVVNRVATTTPTTILWSYVCTYIPFYCHSHRFYVSMYVCIYIGSFRA